METLKTETFGGAFPFAPHYLDVAHCQMHYIDEGEGEPVVFVHGDPTWSYLYRNFIKPLSGQRRCIAPDLMGMGKSSVPNEHIRIACTTTSKTWKACCSNSI